MEEPLISPPKPGFGAVLRHIGPVGFLSFGGTQANLALFHHILVEQLKWVPESVFAELLGIVQSLPGPSAVQLLLTSVTIATGSVLCGLLAILLFMGPAAVVMAVAGVALGSTKKSLASFQEYMGPVEASVGCAATVLVAVGGWNLGKKLAKDRFTKVVWGFACIATFTTATMPLVNAILILVSLLGGGMAALVVYRDELTKPVEVAEVPSVGISKSGGMILLSISWPVLLLVTVLDTMGQTPPLITMIAPYLRVGCLVFGGGPVVIPLLLLQLSASGAIDAHEFALGFGLVQMLPGAMYNLAAFCGALTGGIQGACLCWAVMVTPGVLMALGALPYWQVVRTEPRIQRVLTGVNAGAAGLMGAAVLLLWRDVVDVSTIRVGITVALAVLREVLGLKAYWVVALGLMIGAVISGAEETL